MALHCPATLLLAPAPRDTKGVAELAESLTGERVLGVVREPGDDVGRRLAEVLDVPLEDEPGLTAAEPPPSVLAEISDLHRGETVVVLVAAGEAPFVRHEID